MSTLTVTKKPVGEKSRDYLIDNIKGVFIFLVVFGHLLDYFEDAGFPFAIGVRSFVYFFHMPGFIFMSGYLAKNFSGKRFKGEKLFSYAWLYLLFKDAIELVHYFFGQAFFDEGQHTKILIIFAFLFCCAIGILSWACTKYPKFQIAFMFIVVGISLVKVNIFYVSAAPWYLLSLILWHIFIYLTQHMNPKYVMIGSIILAAVLDYQEEIGKFLSLARTINFLPFFLLGFYMTRKHFYKIIDHPKLKKILAAVLVVYIIVMISFGEQVQKSFSVFYYGVSSYEKLSDAAYSFGPILSLVWMAIATVLIFAVFTVCPRKKTFLSKIGKNTISVYVMHRLFKDILYYAGFYSMLGDNQYIAVAGVFVVSIILTVLFGNDFFAKMITNISTLKTKWIYVDGNR